LSARLTPKSQLLARSEQPKEKLELQLPAAFCQLLAELFPFQDRNDFNMWGVGEHIHGLHAEEAIRLHKHFQISSQGCRITRDAHDSRG
jgi:hypothetical protein